MPATAPTPARHPLTGARLLAWRSALLAGGGHPADLDWLLDLEGGVPWRQLQQLRLEPGRPVSLRCSLARLSRLWHRHRHGHEPLQYLVGVCPWRDLELAVAPGVLIPRQETELLPDLARAAFADGLPPAPAPRRWADLGTGSGCLALALALAWPHSHGHAVDCSPEALAQAAANLERAGLGERVTLALGSWWDPLPADGDGLDLVVSNPPYIPSALVDRLDPVVRLHEPRLALDGGPDGLAAIRAIAAGAPRFLAPGGWLLLEHHHDQAGAVRHLLASVGLEAVGSLRDLEGRERFARARRPVVPARSSRSRS